MANPFKGLGKKLKDPLVLWPIVIVVLAILASIATYFIFDSALDAFFIGLALIIIGGMVVVLRYFLALDRDDRLTRGIEDTAAPPSAGGDETAEQGFARAVEEIRSSRLGAGGLDALPWIAVLGPSGDGKTAALRESGLAMPAEYANRVSGAPTADCDWWLTNDAIVLDLAGRYLACDDDDSEAEWSALLRLLRKQRPGVALNGLVFAISIDTLLGRSASEHEEMALCLRRRVNEASDTLGVDLPIYVMVTKLDHLEGFVECIHASPVVRAGGALGFTNDQRVIANADEKVIEGFRSVLERLEHILPELILREPDRIRRRRIFSFPQEFDEAIRAVARFVGSAFASTPYDVAPYLRGVYFTSASREGVTVSPQLHRLGHDWARNQLEGSLAAGGVMLRDLFQEIIVGDRDIAMPMDRFGERTQRVLNLAAGFLTGLLVLWWGTSFVTNLMGIRELHEEARAVVAGSTTVAGLDKMRAAIERERDDLRLLRRGGLGGTIETAIENAQASYVWGFGREFEAPAKRRIIAAVKGFDSGAFEALANLASDVTFMASRAQGDTPDIGRYAPISENDSDREAFRRGYKAFVSWSSHGDIQARIDREREAVAASSSRLLELRRLESWAESSRAYPPISYADFGLSGLGDSTTEVSGAYTRRAWEGLVVRLLESIDSTGTASGKAKQFRTTYVRRYEDQWRNFLLDTPTPATPLAAASTSPYIVLLEELHDNATVELPRSDAPPPWLLALREVRRDEPLPEETAKPDGKDAEGEEQAAEPAPPPWAAYQATLIPIAADAEAAREDGEAAIALAAQMASRQASNFSKALGVIERMVPRQGDPLVAEKLEQILEMPVLDAASAVMSNAVSELDRRWKSRIVEPYSGPLRSLGIAQLYSGEGAVAQFRTGDLAPFYRDGKAASVIGGRGMPFGGRFLAWMQDAQRLQSVLVTGGLASGGKLSARLQGVPARVEGNRQMRVAERVLKLRCDAGVQTFKYTEGMGQHAFKWSPDCIDLSLQITVLEGGLRHNLAPKEWSGPMAFPEFLQQARRSGSNLMWELRYPDDGVSVLMTYRLRDGGELLAMKHVPPPQSMRN